MRIILDITKKEAADLAAKVQSRLNEKTSISLKVDAEKVTIDTLERNEILRHEQRRLEINWLVEAIFKQIIFMDSSVSRTMRYKIINDFFDKKNVNEMPENLRVCCMENAVPIKSLIIACKKFL